MPRRRVLLIEDNDDHAELVQRAFSKHAADHELLRISNGEQAVAHLSGGGTSVADLVLLDLRLPRVNGLDVLDKIKQHHGLRSLPVVVWTTSENRLDMADAFARGANAYVVKPTDLSGFDRAVDAVTRFWLAWNRTPT